MLRTGSSIGPSRDSGASEGNPERGDDRLRDQSRAHRGDGGDEDLAGLIGLPAEKDGDGDQDRIEGGPDPHAKRDRGRRHDASDLGDLSRSSS